MSVSWVRELLNCIDLSGSHTDSLASVAPIMVMALSHRALGVFVAAMWFVRLRIVVALKGLLFNMFAIAAGYALCD